MQYFVVYHDNAVIKFATIQNVKIENREGNSLMNKKSMKFSFLVFYSMMLTHTLLLPWFLLGFVEMHRRSRPPGNRMRLLSMPTS